VNLEKKLIYTAAFLHMVQSFDKVWYQGLIFKLKSIFPLYYYLLFKSYLEDRHFFLSSSALSEVNHYIHAGFPQGAVEDPFLFNFADDKAVLTLNSEPKIASKLITLKLTSNLI